LGCAPLAAEAADDSTDCNEPYVQQDPILLLPSHHHELLVVDVRIRRYARITGKNSLHVLTIHRRYARTFD
jgi:hypothetical protein